MGGVIEGESGGQLPEVLKVRIHVGIPDFKTTKQRILDNIGTGIDTGERPKMSCTDIQKFNFPVLLLNGERSPKRFREMYAAMKQCKPDIPAPLIVPNVAHGVHFDNPQFYNKAVLDFLSHH